jgi:HlyD family secretion protein
MFRKFVIPFFALVGVIFGIKTVIFSNTPPAVAPPVVEPSQAPFEEFVAGSGIVESASENISIASTVGGVVTKVFVTVGDKIRAGDPLFQIDDREVRADLEVKKASLEVARSELQDAKQQLAFTESISDKRALSVEELSRRRYAVVIADSKLKLSQAQVSAAETEIARRTVSSPIAGSVLQLKVRAGEYAPAQTLANPLILIGDVDIIHLRVDVDENDAWRVREGMNGIGFARGNNELSVPLEFIRFEPYVIPKRTLTGESVERVDTRVLQILFKIEKHDFPLFVGQLMDVYINTKKN